MINELAWNILTFLWQYSEMKWTHEHFSGWFHREIPTWTFSAIAGLDWDDLTKTSGIYRISSQNHKGWSTQVDSELGNYDYLLGIDVRMRMGSHVWPSNSGLCALHLDRSSASCGA